MNKKMQKYGLGIIFVLSILFLYFSFDLGIAAQSIVSTSTIDVIDQGKFVQAEIAVNNGYESTFFFAKQNMSETLADGSTFVANKNAEISFDPKDVICRASLKPITKNVLGLYDYTYYVTAESYSKDVPFEYFIRRDSILVDSGLMTVNTQDSITYTTSDLGEINITNLGSLDKGYQCPSSSAIALIQTEIGLKPVDKANLESRLQNLEYNDLLEITSSMNFLQIIHTISEISLIADTPEPSGYVISQSACPEGSSCIIDYGLFIDELNTGTLEYQLPDGSAVSIVTVNMNAKFVDGIMFLAPSSDIEIIDAWLDKTTIDYATKTNFFVKVKNIGETGDTIRVTPTSSGINTSITPQTYPLEINSGETKTAIFDVYATSNENIDERIDYTVSTSGQFGGTITKTGNVILTIRQDNDPAVTSCGNDKCDVLLGENYINCPLDCEEPTPDPDLERLECLSRPTDLITIGWDYTPAAAFGLIGSSCNPITNYGLFFGIALIIGILIISGAIGFKIKGFKGVKKK